MAYGLIKDSTIQSIADGLREKNIIAKTRDIFYDFDQYKTDWAPTFEDPTPVEATNELRSYKVEIPKADVDVAHTGDFKAFKIVLKVGIVSNDTSGKALGTLSITRTTSMTGSEVVYFGRTIYSEADSGEFEFCTIQTERHGSVPSNLCKVTLIKYADRLADIGISYKVYPVDLDGNTIPCKKVEANTLTPAGIVEAVNAVLPAVGPADLVFSGDCSYKFAYGGWDWLIDRYKDVITTKGITKLTSIFEGAKFNEFLAVINVNNASDMSNLLNNANIRECPKIRGKLDITTSLNMTNLANSCRYIRDFEDLFDPAMFDDFKTLKITSTYSMPTTSNLFQYCYSMRRLPSWFFKLKLNPESTAAPYQFYSIYRNPLYDANSLDEVIGFPVWTCTAAITSSLFDSYFCSRLGRIKDFTFETDNGQPIVAKWKSQTLDITNYIGYVSDSGTILNYNSGITADKRVTNDATYQALKNDPDWWTTDVAYSRYNHDSAVNTINSLPDTSAYLTSAGGTNTIKFKKASGSKTDGGAIENLTDAEKYVATAKGWTIAWV